MPRWNTYTVNSEVAKETQQMAFMSHAKLQPISSASSSASPSTAERGFSNARAFGEDKKMTQRKDHLVLGSPVSSATSRSRERTTTNNSAMAICGWTVACVFGALALTFLIVIYLIPPNGVFPVMVQMYKRPDKPIPRVGRLQVYPGVNTSTYSYVISVDPVDTTKNSMDITEVVQGYPTHDANQPPPSPYRHCWFDNPRFDRPCFFDKGWLGDYCTRADAYGYNNTNGQINPCFLIRIEGTEGWFPEQLRPEYVSDSIRDEQDPAFLGVTCAAKEGDRSGVTFVRRPFKGFSVHFFPMTTFDPALYLVPAVMVQVRGVPRTENVSIECWIRTHNRYMLVDGGHITIDFIQKKVQAVSPYTNSNPHSEVSKNSLSTTFHDIITRQNTPIDGTTPNVTEFEDPDKPGPIVS